MISLKWHMGIKKYWTRLRRVYHQRIQGTWAPRRHTRPVLNLCHHWNHSERPEHSTRPLPLLSDNSEPGFLLAILPLLTCSNNSRVYKQQYPIIIFRKMSALDYSWLATTKLITGQGGASYLQFYFLWDGICSIRPQWQYCTSSLRALFALLILSIRSPSSGAFIYASASVLERLDKYGRSCILGWTLSPSTPCRCPTTSGWWWLNSISSEARIWTMPIVMSSVAWTSLCKTTMATLKELTTSTLLRCCILATYYTKPRAEDLQTVQGVVQPAPFFAAWNKNSGVCSGHSRFLVKYYTHSCFQITQTVKGVLLFDPCFQEFNKSQNCSEQKRWGKRWRVCRKYEDTTKWECQTWRTIHKSRKFLLASNWFLHLMDPSRIYFIECNELRTCQSLLHSSIVQRFTSVHSRYIQADLSRSMQYSLRENSIWYSFSSLTCFQVVIYFYSQDSISDFLVWIDAFFLFIADYLISWAVLRTKIDKLQLQWLKTPDSWAGSQTERQKALFSP